MRLMTRKAIRIYASVTICDLFFNYHYLWTFKPFKDQAKKQELFDVMIFFLPLPSLQKAVRTKRPLLKIQRKKNKQKLNELTAHYNMLGIVL